MFNQLKDMDFCDGASNGRHVFGGIRAVLSTRLKRNQRQGFRFANNDLGFDLGFLGGSGQQFWVEKCLYRFLKLGDLRCLGDSLRYLQI